jgi:hypothetical protein
LAASRTKDWGLGGIIIMDDTADGKKARTMLWAGLPNLRWVRYQGLGRKRRINTNAIAVG